MTPENKDILLKAAKDAVTAAVTGGFCPAVESDDPELTGHQGCFVTLKNGEKLRGCLGQFTSDKPLIDLICEMAKASASRDPRFAADPIRAKELDSLDIEISVLSEMTKTDDPASLRLGVDGIYITKGYLSGCFLPQVATETGWSVEEFLGYCCSHKAGLSPEAWKDSDTEVFLFTADAFSKALSEI